MIVEVVLVIITAIVKVTAVTVRFTTESITAATGTIHGATTEHITTGKITTATTATDRRMTTTGEGETACYNCVNRLHILIYETFELKNEIFFLDQVRKLRSRSHGKEAEA